MRDKFTASDADIKPGHQLELKLIDDVCEEFHEKTNYLLTSLDTVVLDLEEIGLREFIEWIFERRVGFQDFVEPFEDIQSQEYQMWLTQKKRKKEIDYRGYSCWRYNPIVFYKDGGKNRHRIILHEDEETLTFLEQRQFALLSPVTYVGRNNTAMNARYLYALGFDLDGVGVRQIKKLAMMMRDDAIPMANLITNSGHGLHLYYLLEQPVPLYKENILLLNKLKHGLTNVIWNANTSNHITRQYQGVLQGFRLPGTLTKFGEKIRAFHSMEAPMYTIEKLNSYLNLYKLTDDELKTLFKQPCYNPTGVTLDEAARRWPEWYASRILQKKRVGKKWHVKRDVYDWWLNRLQSADKEIQIHHRYWCILTLIVYAVKCDIPRNEVLQDAYDLVPKMDSYTDSEDNHFTEEDVDDAMKAYDENYNKWPIETIEKTTLFRIERNKRNKRKQEAHIKLMNFIRDNISFPDGRSWRKGNGRKKSTSENSKEAKQIAEWRKNNPDSKNKSACSRDTGLDRKTVRKWWDAKE